MRAADYPASRHVPVGQECGACGGGRVHRDEAAHSGKIHQYDKRR